MEMKSQSDKCKGHTDVRDKLIEDHMPLARSLAGRYVNRIHSYDDLVSEGYLAIVETVDLALRDVTDGNYGAYFNQAITWRLRNVTMRTRVPAYLHDMATDEEGISPRCKPSARPEAKSRYRELLEHLQLNNEEIAILRLKLRGYSNIEVAEKLRTTPVEIHRTIVKIRKRLR